MDDSYAASRNRPIVADPPSHEPELGELLADEPGDTRWLDVVGDERARAAPCGGRCQRFGVQGCHSPRCWVGEE